MPCYGPSDQEHIAYMRRIGQPGLIRDEMPAVLCGVFTALGEGLADTLDAVDWREVGVRREDVAAWWTEHKARDEARRRRSK